MVWILKAQPPQICNKNIFKPMTRAFLTKTTEKAIVVGFGIYEGADMGGGGIIIEDCQQLP